MNIEKHLVLTMGFLFIQEKLRDDKKYVMLGKDFSLLRVWRDNPSKGYRFKFFTFTTESKLNIEQKNGKLW